MSFQHREGGAGGRQHHGSVYATAVRKAFIKMEEEDESTTQFDSHPSGRELVEEQRSSLSYTELTDAYHSTLPKDVDRLGEGHNMHFLCSKTTCVGARNGRPRSGFPFKSLDGGQVCLAHPLLRQVRVPHVVGQARCRRRSWLRRSCGASGEKTWELL